MSKIINIDLDLLTKYNLDIESYVICYAKYTELDLKKYRLLVSSLQGKYTQLIQTGWLLLTGSVPSYDTTVLNVDKFSKLVSSTKPSDWMDEWFDLWPKGVKSGGYYVRADKYGCTEKMKRFIRRNPKYSKDIIMQATKSYLAASRVEGYSFIKLAPNFIEKEKVSMLAGECEAILDNTVTSHEPLTNIFGTKEIE